MTTLTSARGGTAMALGAVLTVQASIACAVPLIDRIGAGTAAWLRLVAAGVLLLVLVRPRPRAFPPAVRRATLLLGVATGATTVLFMAAVDRLPLGTASAIEFLGPLGVAVARGGRGALRWPLLAAAGVVLLTRPWHGDADLVGVALALGAAAGWASYILLTQRVGDAVHGVHGLAVSMPVAAIATTVVADPGSVGHLAAGDLLLGAALGVLLVVAYGLEMLSLRRLTTAAFGTLMALEPAVALLIGAVALDQVPGWAGLAGMALVVTAGVGATRAGARITAPPEPVPVYPFSAAPRR